MALGDASEYSQLDYGTGHPVRLKVGLKKSTYSVTSWVGVKVRARARAIVRVKRVSEDHSQSPPE